jgi:general secretion pathway protein I
MLPQTFGVSRAVGRVHGRPGLTLLEVIVSMAIFLIALGAIVPLIQMGQQRALEIHVQAVALQKCQSKMTEVIIGAEPMGSQGEMPFPDSLLDEDWKWSMDASQDQVSQLWTVQVRVYRQLETGKVEVALTQLVLDPEVRGAPALPPPDPAITDPATTDPAAGGTTGGTTGGGGGLIP